ncbi:hypothetical protein [Thermomonospora catenispora]|uniref:hypothetical protein n=1 Tax=Thermomonospora catenispora TaxID=2493090 RepID=UPI00111F98C3|nr:hypothetical protein [Thermomonospora catenispora]TNY34886.1 hypothetical protein EIO00_21505 [Thermomonospora catenispora]
MSSPIRRLIAVIPLVLLPLGTVAACGGEGVTTDCSIEACTVTFDRGVEANVSILGVKVELVGVQGDSVTLRIAGQQITLPVDGWQEVEGFGVQIQSITQEQVVVRISQGGEG